MQGLIAKQLISRVLPFATKLLPYTNSITLLPNFTALSSPYSQLIPALMPSDYGLSFITTAASKAMPFLSSAGGELYNFIGTLTTIFGGPEIMLAIIGVTSLTTTAIYFYSNWDRLDELTWQDYGKLALYILAANATVLSCGVFGMLLIEYIWPEKAPGKGEDTVVRMPDVGKVVSGKTTSSNEAIELAKIAANREIELAKIEASKRPQEEPSLLGSVIKQTTGLDIGADGIKALETIGKTGSNALGVAGTIGITAYSFVVANPALVILPAAAIAASYAIPEIEKAGEYIEQESKKAIESAVKSVEDSIYGSLEERAQLCIDMLKELEKPKEGPGLKKGFADSMFEKIGLDIKLDSTDREQLKVAITKKYKGKDGDPVDLFMQDMTKALEENLKKFHPDRTLPNHLNLYNLYAAKVYPTSRVASSVNQAISEVTAIPGEVARGVQSELNRQHIATEIREGRMATLVDLKTGVGYNRLGEAVSKPKKKHSTITNLNDFSQNFPDLSKGSKPNLSIE